MKQLGISVGIISTFFLILFLYTKIAGPIPFSVNSVVTQKTDTFNATGEGKVSIKPDIATVSVGISAKGNTVKSTQDEINTVINRVSKSIKELGVEEKDIQTTNYSINPNYDYRDSNTKITGYSANTNLLIKIRKLDTVNNVIDMATQNGANQVGGINFDIDDREKVEGEAREKAVEQAKKKAINAAKIAGFKLGRIINYHENSNDFPLFRAGSFATLEVKDSTPTQVEAGSTEIRINITLSYEIN